ncbi:MAG TPA: hypothetical protein VG676_16695 [Chitinophagaceae bacterium]|nr:hypothetical protein [Chitinophagaceae bacterium]
MGFFQKYTDKLFLKQWALGIAKGDIRELLQKTNGELDFQWITPKNKTQFYADPFIIKTPDGLFHLFYEDIKQAEGYGKIAQFVFDDQMNLLKHGIILDEGIHMSYPFVIREDKKVYIIPEASRSGSLYAYEFDSSSAKLVNKRRILNQPIVDPTILKFKDKYWLFGSMKESSNSSLYIFYADDLFGNYTPHPKNPVKIGLQGSRPAGNFIKIDDIIYRPAQNCSSYYGKSVDIFRIISLTTNDYVETYHKTIIPSKNSKYNFALHTINGDSGIIVVDGLRRYWQPFRQFIRKIRSWI